MRARTCDIRALLAEPVGTVRHALDPVTCHEAARGQGRKAERQASVSARARVHSLCTQAEKEAVMKPASTSCLLIRPHQLRMLVAW